jgi:hypothetical protein
MSQPLPKPRFQKKRVGLAMDEALKQPWRLSKKSPPNEEKA